MSLLVTKIHQAYAAVNACRSDVFVCMSSHIDANRWSLYLHCRGRTFRMASGLASSPTSQKLWKQQHNKREWKSPIRMVKSIMSYCLRSLLGIWLFYFTFDKQKVEKYIWIFFRERPRQNGTSSVLRHMIDQRCSADAPKRQTAAERHQLVQLHQRTP